MRPRPTGRQYVLGKQYGICNYISVLRLGSKKIIHRGQSPTPPKRAEINAQQLVWYSQLYFLRQRNALKKICRGGRSPTPPKRAVAALMVAQCFQMMHQPRCRHNTHFISAGSHLRCSSAYFFECILRSYMKKMKGKEHLKILGTKGTRRLSRRFLLDAYKAHITSHDA